MGCRLPTQFHGNAGIDRLRASDAGMDHTPAGKALQRAARPTNRQADRGLLHHNICCAAGYVTADCLPIWAVLALFPACERADRARTRTSDDLRRISGAHWVG